MSGKATDGTEKGAGTTPAQPVFSYPIPIFFIPL